MGDRPVFYATNRAWKAPAFASAALAGEEARLWLGRAMVAHCDDPASMGAVDLPSIVPLAEDDFAMGPGSAQGASASILDAWLATAREAGAVPLLSVHGFNYTFDEGVARAGGLCDWLEAAAGAPAFVPLAFCWPSLGGGAPRNYLTDRQTAAATGPVLARLLVAIEAALERAAPGPLPVIVAHSMGARVLRHGVAARAARPEQPLPLLFSQALIVAGDDDRDVLADPATGPDPDGSRGGLLPLCALARWVTIGVYGQDGAVGIGAIIAVAVDKKLGIDGPDGVLPANVRVVDYALAVCGKVVPAGEVEPNWIGHQYYRNDPACRGDIVAILEDTPPDGIPGRRLGRDFEFPIAGPRAGHYFLMAPAGMANAPLPRDEERQTG